MIYPFAVSLASAARLFTLRQLARHPDLSWRSQPVKRASEFLRPYADHFDKMPGPVGQPFRWRLSAKGKRANGLHVPAINGMSQKADHWLGLGDIWLSLTFYGGRPTEWIIEWDGQFDIYCVWKGMPLLIEYQRTPISSKAWKTKWDKRLTWYRSRTWERKPVVVLVDTTGQQLETMQMPKNTVHVTKIEALPSSVSSHHGLY